MNDDGTGRPPPAGGPEPAPRRPPLGGLSDQRALQRRADGAAAARILGAALRAVDPAPAVRRAITREGTTLWVDGTPQTLPREGRVWCVAAGKAAAPMAQALVERLGPRLTGGVVVVKEEPTAPIDPRGRLSVVRGAHPVPDERSEAAGAAVLALLDRIAPADLVIVLLSGGASSLMVAPGPGLTIDTLRTLGQALTRCGASIHEVNAVRSRLDRLKGGGLACRAAPAPVVTLVLDDVADAPIHVVGSGPTLPIPSGAAPAREVLDTYRIPVEDAVRCALDAPRPRPPPGLVVSLGSNAVAVEAAVTAAERLGWFVRRLPPLRGDASAFGAALADRIARAAPAAPTAWIGGGETTVTVRGAGRGGRNQELALATMDRVAGLADALVVTLATDGEDGPTDAAGAVVDGHSSGRARALGLSPARALADNDAYRVFDALDDLIRTGPTGTNVCDLVLALVKP